MEATHLFNFLTSDFIKRFAEMIENTAWQERLLALPVIENRHFRSASA